METKFKSIATLQEGNYSIIPRETGLHTDESKGVTKKKGVEIQRGAP